jgi:hypothetical protein
MENPDDPDCGGELCLGVLEGACALHTATAKEAALKKA